MHKTIFNIVLGSPPPGGSRGRVLTVIFPKGIGCFGADSGPDPGGNIFEFQYWPHGQLGFGSERGLVVLFVLECFVAGNGAVAMLDHNVVLSQDPGSDPTL